MNHAVKDPAVRTATEICGPRTGTWWADLYSDDYRDSAPQASSMIRTWVQTYLAKPNPDLGRSGAVCPFVRKSINDKTFWAATVRGDDHTLAAEHIGDVVLDAYDCYQEAFGARPVTAVPTLISMFPDVTDCATIARTQVEYKSLFVEQGLMLGEFYPGCPQSGLWNHDFKALDAPVAMLVVRPMKSTDFPFLVDDPAWVRAYLRKFAPQLPSRLRETIADTLHDSIGDAEDITGLRMHRLGEFAV